MPAEVVLGRIEGRILESPAEPAPSGVRKSYIGLSTGISLTVLYLVLALRLGPLGAAPYSVVIGLPLLTTAIFLLTVIWLVEEEARALSPKAPAALFVAERMKLLADSCLFYYAVFFGMWFVLEHFSSGLDWPHFALILMFIAWEGALAVYGFLAKRQLASLGGPPIWWMPSKAKPLQ